MYRSTSKASQKRGFASPTEETRVRRAREGGIAYHRIRGIASIETRMRVARAGGDARSNEGDSCEMVEEREEREPKQNMELNFIKR
ncbi:MAG TPA: hypothetical protein VFI73_10430 [Candidatus Nitrosopolaris sp.]|nr:hypothetical protein [Candidatus Nitrosopolaris sp.]